jgi:hypothetical protein
MRIEGPHSYFSGTFEVLPRVHLPIHSMLLSGTGNRFSKTIPCAQEFLQRKLAALGEKSHDIQLKNERCSSHALVLCV